MAGGMDYKGLNAVFITTVTEQQTTLSAARQRQLPGAARRIADLLLLGKGDQAAAEARVGALREQLQAALVARMERCLQAHRDRPGRGAFMDTTFNECTEALEPDFFAALRLTRSEDCAATVLQATEDADVIHAFMVLFGVAAGVTPPDTVEAAVARLMLPPPRGNAAPARSPAAVERAYKVHVQDLLPRMYVTDDQIIRTHPGAARARDAVLDADVAGDAEDARGEWVARGALLTLLGVICAVVMRAAERRERRRRSGGGGGGGGGAAGMLLLRSARIATDVAVGDGRANRRVEELSAASHDDRTPPTTEHHRSECDAGKSNAPSATRRAQVSLIRVLNMYASSLLVTATRHSGGAPSVGKFG
jgi:hypothetical protein